MATARKIIELYAQTRPNGFDSAKIGRADASRFYGACFAPDRPQTGNPVADRQSRYLTDNLKRCKSDGARYFDRERPLKTTTADSSPPPPIIGGMAENSGDPANPPNPSNAPREPAEKEREHDGGGEDIAKAQKDSLSKFSKPANSTFQEDVMDELDAAVQRILKLYENVPEDGYGEIDEGKRLRTAAMIGMMGLSALGAGKARAQDHASDWGRFPSGGEQTLSWQHSHPDSTARHTVSGKDNIDSHVKERGHKNLDSFIKDMSQRGYNTRFSTRKTD